MDLKDVYSSPERCSLVPHRYIVAIMTALGYMTIIAARGSFALIMTHVTAVNQSTNSFIFSKCTVFNTSSDMKVDMEGDVMLMFHTTFYIAFSVTAFPGSLLCSVVSSRNAVGSSVLVYSIATLLLPVVIPNSTRLNFVLQVVQGLCQTVFYPAAAAFIAAWATAVDKSRLYGILQCGCYIAPAFASVATAAMLCYVRWDAIFYLCGGLSVLWTLVFFHSFYDSPDVHPSLPYEERLYHREHGSNFQHTSTELIKSAPWRCILTSPGVWAMFVGCFSRHLVFSLLLMEQPQYFNDSFGIRTEDLGILLMIPYVSLTTTCMTGGIISDKLIRLGLSRTRTRKLVYSAGSGSEALCMMSLYFVQDWRWAFAIVSTGVAMGGSGSAAYTPLPSEMCPKYTALINGLAQIGSVGGVLITFVASATAGKSKSLEAWQGLHLMVGILHLIGVVLFDIMADATLQPWAEGTPQKSTNQIAADASLHDTAIDDSSSSSKTPLLNGDQGAETNNDQEKGNSVKNYGGAGRNIPLHFSQLDP